ncbi:MAG: FAD-linked oxidase [Puniceicoccaceae bacterium]|nr:FAD-linked oxidase [Puniceicoccaceae bacterium]|tara:strand:+ start:12259 stop:13668 length:1410 start_codon:yes stop_codon:yes gene_type:complete
MTIDSTPITSTTVTTENLEALQAILGEDQVITGKKTEKYSKDFYWYSPVLKEMLEDKRAEVALLVKSKEQLKEAVAYLYEHNIPLVVRGGGSGNYGQLIPLYGGAVIDISGMNTIFSVDGVVHAEVGATIRKIEIAAREKGYEMPCMPSTWIISTIGGFLCGGSGGIGSIRNGGIAYKDNVKSVTIMTMEAEPKFIKLEERDAIKALHTYGTTGIMVEVEMRLAQAFPWEQLIFVHDDWQELLDWSYEVACDDSIPKRLVSVFENPISNFFKPLRKHIPADKHTTFFMVDEACAEKVIASAKAAGIEHVFSKPFGNPPKPPFITDYTWNHTTLWAIKADPSITYLQCGFGEDFNGNFKKLKDKYGDEVLIHIEMTLGNSKFRTEKPGVSIGGIPLIRYTSEERLNEIIAYCESIGVAVANPHTYTMEGGGAHPDLSEKQALKDLADPKGLMNPGKMASYKHNPLATAEV